MQRARAGFPRAVPAARAGAVVPDA